MLLTKCPQCKKNDKVMDNPDAYETRIDPRFWCDRCEIYWNCRLNKNFEVKLEIIKLTKPGEK